MRTRWTVPDAAPTRILHAVRGQRTLAVAGLVVLVVGAAAIVGLTSSGTTPSTSILSVISGDVLVRPAPGAPLRGGEDGEALSAGAIVQTTTPNGRAVLTFDDGSTDELEPGTDVAIDELFTGTRGELLVRLRHERGKAWVHVQPQISPNARFNIATPSATMVVRGTSLEIEVGPVAGNGAAVTTVDVFQGQVDVVAAGQVQPVTAGHQTEVVEGSPPGPVTPVTLLPVCLRMTASSAAMIMVTDPDGRSAGQTPHGVVSQIPRTSLAGPQDDPQVVDVFSPRTGDWELGIAPRGEGGPFQVIVGTVGATTTGTKSIVTGSIEAGQRLVTQFHVDESGRTDRFTPLQPTVNTRANIALTRIGSTTTAPVPRAQVFAPVVDQDSPSCR